MNTRTVEGSHDKERWFYLGTIPDSIPENEDQEWKYIQQQGWAKVCKYVRIIRMH
jgi:hypothetical protein